MRALAHRIVGERRLDRRGERWLSRCGAAWRQGKATRGEQASPRELVSDERSDGGGLPGPYRCARSTGPAMIGDRGHARKQPVARRVLEREDKRRQIAARATRRARGTLCCRTRCRSASSHRPGNARAPTAATSARERRGTRRPPRPRAIRGCAAIARGSVSPRATARHSAGVPEAHIARSRAGRSIRGGTNHIACSQAEKIARFASRRTAAAHFRRRRTAASWRASYWAGHRGRYYIILSV